MGVPKFFRWVAERFPSVITPYRDFSPPVDNLYLDMNGIIHNCTHTNDVDATQKSATEKAMVEAMFVYLEKLFNAIQPRKHFMLAVDGVAPRAKMNQQRQRRYRSGYEMMVARQEALERGEELPDEKEVFDSNCITPGTNFMARVSEQFQYFITMKIATDPAWQTCKVIYSGHDHPGEGEHKIVEFIRRRKSQPGYSPNETHCMYGLDADLIMLSLATHEPHFLLLREVVTFGSAQEPRRVREQREEDESHGIVADKSYQKADEFVLFHVNVLRDYIDLDVRSRLGTKLPDNYDLERVLDDFVLMCFFIGNDFLPTIPTLGINDGSLLQMLDIYSKRVLIRGMYLTDKGQVNWPVVELWLGSLGKLELETIKAREQQEQEYQRKMEQRDSLYEAQVESAAAVTSLREYKDRFYRDKHGFEDGWDPEGEEIAALKLHYIEGILWVMGYYYKGPPSWKWFFPHHYAPMASDLVNLAEIAAAVQFDLGEPFLPHQQLLAVLPPMSYRSIPSAYWPLLRNKSSPLAKYFPDHLQIDREGARAPWEGIVLIPFIEENVLLAAYKSVQSNVTSEDQAYNRLGQALCFSFDTSMDPVDVPNSMFGPLRAVKVRREVFKFPPPIKSVLHLCQGVLVGEKQLEGFASLHPKWSFIDVRREIGAVTIFGMPTRKESIILGLRDSYNFLSAKDAVSLLGREVLVGFPHYRRARVSSIGDKHVLIQAFVMPDGVVSGTNVKDLNRDESMSFTRECETHKKYMKEKLGIAVDTIRLLVYVNLFTGMHATRKGRIVRSFAKSELCYPIQLVSFLEDVDMLEDSRYVERDRVEYDMEFDNKVIFIGSEPKGKKSSAPVHGSMGIVLERNTYGKNTYSVSVKVYDEPVVLPPALLSFAALENWMALHDVSAALGVGSFALRQLTGSLRTTPQYGSREVGLGLVFTRNHLARVGYAKLVARHTNAWTQYSDDVFARLAQNCDSTAHYLDTANRSDYVGRSGRGTVRYTAWFTLEAVEIIRRYVNKFQPLVKRIECGTVSPHALEPPQFMTGEWENREVDDVLSEIKTFIDDCGISKVPLLSASDDVFSREHLKALEDELDRISPRKASLVTLRPVMRRNLYFPITRSASGHVTQLPLPQEQTFSLGARVVNCCAVGGVPFGASGTIVRLLSTNNYAEVVYDEPFTCGSYFDGRLRQPRGGLTKLSSLLVLNKPDDIAAEGALTNTATTATTAAGENAALARTTPGSVSKPPTAKLLREQGQAAICLQPDGGPAIPRPRSAIEVIPRASDPGVTMASTPGAVTLCAGAGGICLADLVGKLKTAPDNCGGFGGVAATPTMLGGQEGSRQQTPATLRSKHTATVSPSTIVTDAAGNGSKNSGRTFAHGDRTTPSCVVQNYVDANNRVDSGAGLPQHRNNSNKRDEEKKENEERKHKGNGASGASRGVSKADGNGGPKTAASVMQDILNNKIIIGRGSSVAVFRQLAKMRLSEELVKFSESQ